MFGTRLLTAFAEFKTVWDPAGRMNPGKLVAPYRPDENLREGPDHRPWAPETRLAFTADGSDFSRAATRCVGVGECRKHDHGIMCPSYVVTRDEQHSTRGRARLLFEMTKGDVVRDGWRSQAVHDALDLCLSCKACRTECPVKVDMASYKAEFMYHHYRKCVRPRAAYSMGLIWWWARAGGQIPQLANFLTGVEPFATLSKSLGGIAQARSIPRFATPHFRAWFARRTREHQTSATRGRVLLWPDTFNSYFTTAPLQAAVEVLESEGWSVELPKRVLCCGRPLYAFGFLDLADRLWDRTLADLEPAIRAGTPIVGLEPTCIAAFRDELLQMRPRDRNAQRLAGQVVHLSEFLTRTGYSPPQLQGRALVHAHCHHRSLLNIESEVSLLSKAGLEVELLDAGCCGMAGDYGFRKETYALSEQLGERCLLPRARSVGETVLVADGFSCREQVRQGAGRIAKTLPEVLRGLEEMPGKIIPAGRA
jgi:Fe-S oxidoreductase